MNTNRFRQLVSGFAALCFFNAVAKDVNYTVVPDFFEANPGGQALGPCHGGLVIDAAGNIYISTDTERGILEFSQDGKLIRSFGPTRIHDFQLRSEKGANYLYCARPADHDVLKIDMEGHILWTIHYPKESGVYKDENGFKPCSVTVGPDDSVYIADGYGANYVLKYDKDQHFVKAFGGKGAEEGKFDTCHGIGLDTRLEKPLLFICNRANRRVEYWDLDGNFVRTIQKGLRLPSKVTFQGNYAVIPELEGRVTILDQAGNIYGQLGDNPDPKKRANYGLPPDQWIAGQLNSPHGSSMDKAGNVYVSEWSKYGRLHKFVPNP